MSTFRHIPLHLRVLAGVAALAGTLVPATIVTATTTATAGTSHCTITARAPRLDLFTATIRGTAYVSCATTTMVAAQIGVVELDGATEQTIIATQTRWVVVNAGTTVVVATDRAACVSTEIGGEEFATKARLNLSGVVSAWDRTTPDPDSYLC